MPNHLTPEELSKELGIDRTEVIKVCVQEGVPIYQGKIDKFLFQAQLQAIGATAVRSTSVRSRTASFFDGRALRERLRAAPSSQAPSLRRAPCAAWPRRRSS